MDKALVSAVDRLLRAFAKYSDNKEQFWSCVNSLRDACPLKVLDQKHSDLHMRAIEFLDQVDAYDHRSDIDLEPSDDFWRSLLDLERERNEFAKPPKSHRPPESVELLLKQGVPAHQVAAIWGLVDEQGRPQVGLVEKELAHPGSIINEQYVHPEDERAKKRDQERYEAYQAFLVERNAAIVKANEPCPETPEELYLQGVNVRQAAMMLRRPSAEVEKLWIQFQEQHGAPNHTPLTTRDNFGYSDYTPTIAPDSFSAVPAYYGDEEEEDAVPSAYDNLSDDELRELCKSEGFRGYAQMKRETMLTKLQELDQDIEAAVAGGE